MRRAKQPTEATETDYDGDYETSYKAHFDAKRAAYRSVGFGELFPMTNDQMRRVVEKSEMGFMVPKGYGTPTFRLCQLCVQERGLIRVEEGTVVWKSQHHAKWELDGMGDFMEVTARNEHGDMGIWHLDLPTHLDNDWE